MKSSVADPGILSRIRILPSRIRIGNKEFLTQIIVTNLLTMFISGPEFFSIPDPGLDSGVKKTLDRGSKIRIRIRNTVYEYTVNIPKCRYTKESL